MKGENIMAKRFFSLVVAMLFICIASVGLAEVNTIDKPEDMEFIGGLHFGESISSAKSDMAKVYGVSTSRIDEWENGEGTTVLGEGNSKQSCTIAGISNCKVRCLFSEGTGTKKIIQVCYFLPTDAADPIKDALESKYGNGEFVDMTASGTMTYKWIIEKNKDSEGTDFYISIWLYYPLYSNEKVEIYYVLNGALRNEYDKITVNMNGL